MITQIQKEPELAKEEWRQCLAAFGRAVARTKEENKIFWVSIGSPIPELWQASADVILDDLIRILGQRWAGVILVLPRVGIPGGGRFECNFQGGELYVRYATNVLAYMVGRRLGVLVEFGQPLTPHRVG